MGPAQMAQSQHGHTVMPIPTKLDSGGILLLLFCLRFGQVTERFNYDGCEECTASRTTLWSVKVAAHGQGVSERSR
jgi:hypothetical protein